MSLPGDADYRFDRLVAGDDVGPVATIEAASFTNPWTRDMLEREILESDVARLYVMSDASRRVIAFCACWIVLDELHINTIAVEPGLRRRGMARKLMGHVFAAATAEGAATATLEVRESNDPARRLYGSLGFEVSGVRRGYYSNPDEDALVLWRRCPGPAEPQP